MSVNAQEMICKAYGYKDILRFDELRESIDIKGVKKMVKAFPKLSKANENKIKIIDDNKDKKCIYCGKVHNKGYTSLVNANHLIKSMISNTYNECYSLSSRDNFICEYCGFASVSYGSEGKNEYGKKSPFGLKMINSLITHDYKKVDKYFNSDEKNELYEIITNPPKTPFIILINSRGTVLENLVFNAKPTLSKDWIVVNYGLNNLEVNPNEVIECLEEANVFALLFKIEPTSDHIFNRQDEVSARLPYKYLINEDFMNKIYQFISKYNRDCRLVAKMIQKVYLKNNKPKKINNGTAIKQKKTNTKDSLFDF